MVKQFNAASGRRFWGEGERLSEFSYRTNDYLTDEKKRKKKQSLRKAITKMVSTINYLGNEKITFDKMCIIYTRGPGRV